MKHSLGYILLFLSLCFAPAGASKISLNYAVNTSFEMDYQDKILNKKTLKQKKVNKVIDLYAEILKIKLIQLSLEKNKFAIQRLYAQYSRRVELGVGKKSLLLQLDKKLTMLEIKQINYNNYLKQAELKMRELLKISDEHLLDLLPIQELSSDLINIIRELVFNDKVEMLNNAEMTKIREQIIVASYDYNNKESISIFSNFNQLKIKQIQTNILKEKNNYYVRNNIIMNLKKLLTSYDNIEKYELKHKELYSQIMNIERDNYVEFTSMLKTDDDYIKRAQIINEFYTLKSKILSVQHDKIVLQYKIINTTRQLLYYLNI